MNGTAILATVGSKALTTEGAADLINLQIIFRRKRKRRTRRNVINTSVVMDVIMINLFSYLQAIHHRGDVPIHPQKSLVVIQKKVEKMTFTQILPEISIVSKDLTEKNRFLQGITEGQIHHIQMIAVQDISHQ